MKVPFKIYDLRTKIIAKINCLQSGLLKEQHTKINAYFHAGVSEKIDQ